MLQKIQIHNFAIIDFLEFAPSKGFTTITGETGAGKSIILGALALILGERADSSVLINKEKKCSIEAFFDVKNNELFRAQLLANDLDDEPICVIRREINPAGKSRAFVNDTPVNLSTLNQLMSLLVDLHQQFDNAAIEDDHFQIEIIDAISNNGDLRKQYSTQFNLLKSTQNILLELKAKAAKNQKEADYFQHLLDELVLANFQENEIEESAQQLKALSNSEKITQTLQATSHLFTGGEIPFINELKKSIQSFQSIADWMPETMQITNRLQTTYEELKDIAQEIEMLQGKIFIDENQINALQDRVDLGYRLLKKHAVLNTPELIEIQQKLALETTNFLTLDQQIETTEKAVTQHKNEVTNLGKQLSEKRAITLPVLTSQINELLHLVGMPNARLVLNLTPNQTPNKYGTDQVAFLLDANKTGQLVPLYKAASGGEMSRIMLCIKSLTAKAMQLPTLVFDEVDTGISGEAAKQVGLLLQKIAKHHQIICITHQPQVAAKGDEHFYVFKEADINGKLTTQIKPLPKTERVNIIAQMIDGENPSEAALNNAKELIK